jgi:DNA-binding GntR family transcriptional regulator
METPAPGAETPPREPTQVTRLARAIAEAIVDGALTPGARLDEAGLASRYGVSRTPVREALRNLAASGLVEHRPHRGAVVALPDAPRLLGMFELMAELEATAARFAALRMGPAARRALATLHEEAASVMRAGDPATYEGLNLRFHHAIFEGSGNPFLEETAQAMRVRIRPFSRGQFNLDGRLMLSHAEHGEIVTAIAQGDAARAEAAMRVHVRRIAEAATGYLAAASRAAR